MHELSDAQVGKITLMVLGAMVTLMATIVVAVYAYALTQGYAIGF